MKNTTSAHSSSSPVLLCNQVIGTLFSDLTTVVRQYRSACLFCGIPYQRTPAALRIFTWLFYSIQLALHLVVNGRKYANILIVSNPPLAPLLAPISCRPFSLLLYDLYPHVLGQLQPSNNFLRLSLSLIIRFWHCANRYAYSRADRVFTLSDSMAAELRSAFATEALWREKVVVIPLWADIKAIYPDQAAAQLFRKRLQLDSHRLLIIYSGNLGFTHPLEPLLDAASQLQDKSQPSCVQFLLIGNGQKRTELECRAESLRLLGTSLRFFDPLPYSEVSGMLSAADLAVVALDGPAASASLPSKTFNAMACGTPLLVIAPAGSALAQLVLKYRCGIVIEPGPLVTRDLISAISDLTTNPDKLLQLGANALLASGNFTSANADKLVKSWLYLSP